ncbi:hypothetical protein YC2023_081370 [Brassica napus]
MSNHASPTARVIPSDHSVHADHNFPLDHADQTVRTDPSDHRDRPAPYREGTTWRQSSTLGSISRHSAPLVSSFIPSVLLPFGSSPYLSLPVECSFLRAHQVVSEPLFRKSSKEKPPRQTVSQFPFKYSLNNFDEFVNVQERPDIRSKMTRDVADPKRRLLQFDVQEICDNFEKGIMKALKDISKSHKKSTSTRAPVAEPSLFISEKPKGKSETHVEEYKYFSDFLPIFDESDEEPIESLFSCEKNCDLPSLESEFMNDNEQTIVELTVLQPEHLSSLVLSPQVFEEEPLDLPHQGPHLDTRISFDEYLDHIFDEEDEPGPEREVQLLRNESFDRAQQPEIWRSFVVQTGYLGDANDRGSVQKGYLNIPKHRPVWFMDTAQGGVLVYQLDQTEVFMSDHASAAARAIPSDHSIHADHNFPIVLIRPSVLTHPITATVLLLTAKEPLGSDEPGR